MAPLRAHDIMSSDLIVVAPKTGVDRIVTILLLNMISAVPVVDEKFHILGIVSEGDLVDRGEAGTLPRKSWWLGLFQDEDELARRYTKAHGKTAEDVMTRHVISVGPDAPAERIADIMRRHHVKRVPVVEDGKLVGIVSRADIVQMVAVRGVPAGDGPRADNEIQADILDRLRNESWASPQFLSVSVAEGTVDVSGMIGSSDQKMALNVLIGEVPGVTAVNDFTTIMTVPTL
jgi:CBS-domain-containing membrane protein